MIKKIIYSFVFVIFLFTLVSCNKDEKENTNDEYLDVNSFELFEYKNEVSHEEFIKKFEEKVQESYSILENDFVMSEDIYTLEYQQNNKYTEQIEKYFSNDGMYDKDNNVLERRYLSKRTRNIEGDNTSVLKDYEDEQHFQSIKSDGNNYEIDLLDKSYEKIDVELNSTIRYVFNDTFYAKFKYPGFVNNKPECVTTYIDGNLFTFIFEFQYTLGEITSFIRKDIYQTKFENNEITIYYDLNSDFGLSIPEKYTYKAFSIIKSFDNELESKLEGNDLTLNSNKVEEIENTYSKLNNHDIGTYSVYAIRNDYTVIFQESDLTSMTFLAECGVFLTSGTKSYILILDGNDFINHLDLNKNGKFPVGLFKRIAERHYLLKIDSEGNISDYVYSRNEAQLDFLLGYIGLI